MLAAFESFNFDLTSVAYFQTTPRTMYLTPDPEAPFAEMTNALVSASLSISRTAARTRR